MRNIIFLFLVAIAFVGCKKDEWTAVSERPQQEIKIDGDAAEWVDQLRFDDQATVGYAINNDDQYLYLCIKPNKEIFRQVMRGGLIVWFDSTAQGKKILGIKYPLGMQSMEPGSRLDQMDMNMEEGQHPMLQHQAALFGEMEIIGPEKEDVNRASAQNNFGIQAAIGGMPDEPVYELKIPLQTAKGKPYAIATTPGATISIGIESGKIEKMSHGGGPGGMRRPGGGMGPGGGGMGPEGGGMGPGGRRGEGPPPGMESEFKSNDPIKIWFKVQLAQ